MSVLEAAILGLLQGLTEFLPVSSSGHLALARGLLGERVESGAAFEVMVHLGTLASILLVFWSEVKGLFGALAILAKPGQWREACRSNESFRMGALILLSAIPAGLFGVLAKDSIEALFDQPRVVGVCLMVTGVWLFAARFAPAGGHALNAKVALAMGFAQAFAVLPGISRSGATIGAGLFAGGAREAVGRFAFLMAIVPIVGAGLLTAKDMAEGEGGAGAGVLALLVGALVAFLSGIFALRVLLRFVARGRLYLFAPYCLALGLLAIFGVFD